MGRNEFMMGEGRPTPTFEFDLCGDQLSIARNLFLKLLKRVSPDT
jgi:hypothetical protein